MSLARYKQKRDFKVTSEPPGKQVRSRGPLRLVIQKHAASRLHYDFRLELGGVLLSWAVPKGPSLNPADRRLAVHVEDHPVDYGGFEGTIPEGEYGGGSVIVWDRGHWLPEGDPEAGYRSGHLKFTLAGEKLRGGFSLVRMHGRRNSDKADNWLLLKQHDDEVDEDGEVLVRDHPESVISGLTVEAIADTKPPTSTARSKTSTSKAKSKTSTSKASKATSKAPAKARSKATSKASKATSKASKATSKTISSARAAARKPTSKASTATSRASKTTRPARATASTATKATRASTTSKPGPPTRATPSAARAGASRRASKAPARKASPAATKAPPPAIRAALARSARSLATAKLPLKLVPELATLVDTVPAGPEWLHEVKFDGYRLIARIDGEDIRLLTRRGEDWSARFPWLITALRARFPGTTTIVDGELVHLGADGVTRFADLQRALSEHKHDALVYFAFDLLHLQGLDLRPLPLEQRKQALAELLPLEARPGRVRLTEHIVGQGEPLFARACRLGLEGVISKRRAAPYRAGRFRDWLKVKCGKRQEVVIGGFNPARSGDREIGALLVGVYNDVGELVYAGKVGSGFDFTGASELRARLERRQTAKNPFTRLPPGVARTLFVRPELVAEVSFSNWTTDGRMRHPVFEGIREDRRPTEVHRERPLPLRAAITDDAKDDDPAEPASPPSRPRKVAKKQAAPAVSVLGVPISHPDRALFPADDISKRELAEYYAATAPWMLPWVTGRPLSVVRCPDNADKPCFFQKHIHHELPPGVLTADLDDGGAEAPYLYIKDARGLVGLTQVGTVELHIWGSTVAHPDAPDRVVIDLDPDDAVPWDRVKETAHAVRGRLTDLELVSFLKTTGGKGLHVVLPLTPGKQTWDQVKSFARGIALEFTRAAPKLFTATATKTSRTGKIYIDYLRNYRGSTSVAPYSVRARPGAPVSVPLDWDELDELPSSQHYTLKNLAARLSTRARNNDPWRELATVKQFLTASVLRGVAKRR